MSAALLSDPQEVTPEYWQKVREEALDRVNSRRVAKEQLEEILLAALHSGEPIEVTPAMWDDLRQNLRARAKARESAMR